MENRKKEFWWLVALEATVFLSFPCWESTASWAEPVGNPFRFGVAVVVGATAAMLACHVGVAAFAAKFGERPHLFWWFLLPWLGVGYVEWILGGARLVASASGSDAAPVFFVILLVAAWARGFWKPVAIGGLLLGAGILAWALAMNWPGLWTRNPHFSTDPPQFDWEILKGMLLSAVPLVVIAWRTGRIEPESKRIWLSGFVGVWLPLVLSVTMALLSAQAGANLHYVPSLPRGFIWALVAPQGRLQPVLIQLASWTVWWPALLSAVSIRALAPRWETWRRKIWLVPIAVCLLLLAEASTAWDPDGFFGLAGTPAHQLWAASLILFGAAAGLVCVASRFLAREKTETGADRNL